MISYQTKYQLPSIFSTQTLFGRFLIIFLTPIIILQCINSYVFYQRHWDNVTNKMQSALIGEILTIYDFLKDGELSNDDLKKLKNLGVEIAIKKGELNYSTNLKGEDDEALESLKSNLKTLLPVPFTTYYIPNTTYIKMEIPIKNSILELGFSSKRIESPTADIFIGWMLGSSIFLYAIAILFMKKQLISIAKLAEFADKLGKGHEVEFFQPAGAKEIKNAGEAIILMRDRIARNVAYRTELLAHISHDLRTPLTRIKLQLAILKDGDIKKKLNDDLTEIENMIVGYLNFAKEEGNEKSELVEVSALLKELVNKYHNKKIKLNNSFYGDILLRKLAIKRAVANLIDNALKFAKRKVIISTKKQHDNLMIIVEDDGPGMTEKQHEKVFEPFFKGDNSEGHGLGLTIVKNIVQSHGGKVSLSKSSLGGLKITVLIPI